MEGSLIVLVRLSGYFSILMFVLSIFLGSVSKALLYPVLILLGAFLGICSIQTWQGGGCFYSYIISIGGAEIAVKYIVPVLVLFLLGKGLISFFEQFFFEKGVLSKTVGTLGILLILFDAIMWILSGFKLDFIPFLTT